MRVQIGGAGKCFAIHNKCEVAEAKGQIVLIVFWLLVHQHKCCSLLKNVFGLPQPIGAKIHQSQRSQKTDSSSFMNHTSANDYRVKVEKMFVEIHHL